MYRIYTLTDLIKSVDNYKINDNLQFEINKCLHLKFLSNTCTSAKQFVICLFVLEFMYVCAHVNVYVSTCVNVRIYACVNAYVYVRAYLSIFFIVYVCMC